MSQERITDIQKDEVVDKILKRIARVLKMLQVFNVNVSKTSINASKATIFKNSDNASQENASLAPGRRSSQSK